MKISQLSATGMTVGGTTGESQSMVQKIRSMKMNTQATPEAAPQEVDPVAEVPIEETTTETKAAEDTTPLSPQLAAIAKQRRALQVKEREIADREKALTEKEAATTAFIDPAKLKSDTLGVLLANGIGYEQLTEAVLASQNGITPQVTALETKVKELEAALDKKLADRDVTAKQQALAEMRKEAALLSAQGEDFALVRETQSLPTVMRLIEHTFDTQGEILDVREALALVETELLNDSLKLAKIQKVQGSIVPPEPVLPPAQQQRQMKTLTNRDTASAVLTRKAKAIAAFNGTLKK